MSRNGIQSFQRLFHQFSSWVFALNLLFHPPHSSWVYRRRGSLRITAVAWRRLRSKEFNLAQRGLGFVLLGTRSLMPTTGCDGWMASLIQWTWVWVSSRRWWRTGKPGVLQAMGSQRARQDWATEQQRVAEQRIVFVISEVYRSIMTLWAWADARAKDSDTKKAARTNYLPPL